MEFFGDAEGADASRLAVVRPERASAPGRSEFLMRDRRNRCSSFTSRRDRCGRHASRVWLPNREMSVVAMLSGVRPTRSRTCAREP